MFSLTRTIRKAALFILSLVIAVGSTCGVRAEVKGGAGTSFTLSQGDIESIYRDFVTAHMPWSKEEATITRIAAAGRIVLPSSNYTCEVVPPANDSYAGNAALRVIFRVDGREVKKELVTGYVDVLRDVVCVSRPLARHEVIQAKDLCVVRRSILQAGAAAVYDVGDVAGYRLLTSLRAGDMVKKDMIERAPILKKGDRITILAEKANLVITALGEALEPGREGEMIRVRNTGSRNAIHARVIDAPTVQVQI